MRARKREEKNDFSRSTNEGCTGLLYSFHSLINHTLCHYYVYLKILTFYHGQGFIALTYRYLICSLIVESNTACILFKLAIRSGLIFFICHVVILVPNHIKLRESKCIANVDLQHDEFCLGIKLKTQIMISLYAPF